MTRSTDTDTIVHTLWRGQPPPCGFTTALPRDWPPGHAWISPGAVDTITCPACKRWAQKFNKNNKRR